MAFAISVARPTEFTGSATADPTSDQSATCPVRSLHGSSGPTPVSGSRGDATSAIPSGTPMFRDSRPGPCAATGVAAATDFVGVAGARTGVAGDLAAVAIAGVVGGVSVVSLP